MGRVTAWRSDDPLGPITVLVPNLATGERVAELVTAGGAAVVGLEVRTLEDLARAVLERTGAAGGLGLPPGARQLLVRGLLAGPEAPPELAALSDRPGLLSAVGAGLRDLVDANVGELDAGERAAAGPLGTLHGAHLGRRLELDVDDDSSRFVRALERAAEAPFRRLLVHGIYDPTGLQERFLAACLAVAGEAVMLVPAHGRALAERLQKGAIEVRIEPSDLRLERERFAEFWQSFVHVLRNAVDHGIEAPDQRAEVGKPEQGVLELKTFVEGEDFVVELQDDGRGIDWDAIRGRAEELGIEHDSVEELLFHDGLSTLAEASQTSGRGVGMGAAKSTCEALGGTVTVSTEAGSGTCVQFRFPADLMVDYSRTH